jgi:hypothetical protein
MKRPNFLKDLWGFVTLFSPLRDIVCENRISVIPFNSKVLVSHPAVSL